jgi:hypothetical protein
MKPFVTIRIRFSFDGDSPEFAARTLAARTKRT